MPITPRQLEDLLRQNIPDAQVSVRDMTGTSDHFAVDVTSPAFVGKSLVDQHKLVHAACGAHLGAAIHALQIKTRVPS
jgi:stress-induced morphogen